MERKTIIKIMAALFIPLMIYSFFNWDMIIGGIQTLSALSVIVVIFLLILGIPFVWFLGMFIQAKLLNRMHGSITAKPKNALKMEKRIEFARKCINDHRMTDPIMMSDNGREMVIIRHEPSPSREDAIQWDIFLFTTTDERANWNPMTGLDGIPHDKLFYVITNSMTGESYLMRFEQHDEAQKYFRNLWQSGVMKIEATEYDKALRTAVLQGIGSEVGKKAIHKEDDEDKSKEESNE